MTSFEPILYLAKLDPMAKYTSQKLTGGVVNTTFRATKATSPDTTASSDFSRFRSHPSIIIKHALPYIAGIGAEAPMTLLRQTIEARALSLFSPDSPARLNQLATSTLYIPELLYHDNDANVLVLSDLGPLPNLSDIFSDLGGHSPGHDRPPSPTFESKTPIKPQLQPTTSSSRPSLSTIPISAFHSLGSQLGTFFAHLHSPATLDSVTSRYSADYLSNLELRDSVFNYAIRPVSSQLKLFPSLLTSTEADALGETLVSDFQRPLHPSEQSFVIGDCWTGTILIDISEEGLTSIGVIDWEFAGIGRGAHGDIAQFLAHLELLRISATYSQHSNESSPAFDRVEALISSFVTSYSKLYRPTFLALPLGIRLNVMRSAILSHAAEMINCAFWKAWPCHSSTCPAMEQRHSVPQECDLIKAMIERALRLLRVAGESRDGFEERLRTMIEEKGRQNGIGEAEGMWLMDLFEDLDR